jgi:plasmid stabilization system protein ParE
MSAHNRPVVLSPEAQADYEDIQAYTLRQWGERPRRTLFSG